MSAPPLRVATLAGDGIGPEVTHAAVAVLQVVCERLAIPLQLEALPYGATWYLATGTGLPAGEVQRLARSHDAILAGALGDPRVKDHAHVRLIRQALLTGLDLYANIRPATLLSPTLSPLSHVQRGARVDLVVISENLEGFHADRDRRVRVTDDEDAYVTEEWHVPHLVARLLRFTFEWARQRGRRRVTLVDKTNLVPAHRLWRHAFQTVAIDYPELSHDVRLVDTLAHDLVRAPERLDVLVTTNLFGEILSDLTAGLVGGMGIAASANLHPGRCSLFEPVHGSAPDLVGTGRANPLAAIRTAGLLLDTCGHREAAGMVHAAVLASLAAQVTTPDLGGRATTEMVTDYVLRHLRLQPLPERPVHAGGR
ncbi:MAG TPA: isocitrate/isopropylmalate family dehydrogenase [Gemmatimonadaceae bacterium]|mgnify:CR=1 FL=1|nr:isocitrate/isopropylmalate family dehydrogenase [Gemmatimonadaceae bacterium]